METLFNSADSQATAFREAWQQFSLSLQQREERLLQELQTAWDDLREQRALSVANGRELDGVPSAQQSPIPLDWLYATAKPRLLESPLRAFFTRKPLRRALTALEDYRNDLPDLARLLPEKLDVTAAEFFHLLHPAAPHGLRGHLRKVFWFRPKPVYLRRLVLDHLQQRDRQRQPLDANFLLAATTTASDLLAPWQIIRAKAVGLPQQAMDLRARLAFHTAAPSLANPLESHIRWINQPAATLRQSLLRHPQTLSPSESLSLQEATRSFTAYWSRMESCIENFMRIEEKLSLLGHEVFLETSHALELVDSERSSLLAEVSAICAILTNEASGQSPATPEHAQFQSAEDRLQSWFDRAARKADLHLPSELELALPAPPSPWKPPPWRQIHPLKLFRRGIAYISEAPPVRNLEEVEAIETAVIRDIERAREVAAYGRQLAATEGPTGETLSRESLTNALNLLDHRARTVPDLRALAASDFARIHTALFALCYADLHLSRAGFFAYISRLRGLQAWQQFLRSLVRRARQLSLHAVAALHRLFRWLLTGLGLITPARPRPQPLKQRPTMSSILELPSGIQDLPGLYKRLFRLDPVEDSRFLVGRQVEMGALESVCANWRSGQPGTVLLIGARGSGKTSLLNCAQSALFTNDIVIRAEFRERLTTAPALHQFLRQILALPQDADLVAALTSQRRILILEEFERCFLKTMGGFAAVRALLDLMYATAPHTLWLLCSNEMAFRYLEATVGLERHFHSIINAAAVSSDDLRNAILQRHSLSGLRLEFLAPTPSGYFDSARNFLKLNDSPETRFFDSLYQESEGIFRSAFELWQASILKVDSGVIRMRQPIRPAYRELFVQLQLEDCFTLQAILQHGSLTPDELALVLNIPLTVASRLLDRLTHMELLECEPARPGIRICPEAIRAVREALHRQNLSLERS